LSFNQISFRTGLLFYLSGTRFHYLQILHFVTRRRLEPHAGRRKCRFDRLSDLAKGGHASAATTMAAAIIAAAAIWDLSMHPPIGRAAVETPCRGQQAAMI
jgi:hypothetical protein